MRRIALALLVTFAFAAAAIPSEARRADGACERRDADTVVTLEGKVMELPTGSRMVLFQADGTTYLLHMGPRWFWEKNGYALAVPDRIRVTGQVSGGDASSLNLYPHSIAREGVTYTLADAEGRPAWAGSGKGWGGCDRGCDGERERGGCRRGSSWGRGAPGPHRG